MTFHIKGDSFYLDDNKVFLNSGEIHYFRIKRELWDKHLQAAKEAGLMAVSTYVPWAWHEAEESVFDFNGTSCPERDLDGWIQQCRANGLYCILKPGPFILAEFRGAGLPDWLLSRYDELLSMRTSRGERVQSEGVSLFNPIYLEKVRKWYDMILPFIRERQLSAGGPVIMMQICNEIGVFSWLAHQGDYCEIVREKFISFLKRKFLGIGKLNELWGTAYSDFSGIALPPDGRLPYASKGDRSRDYEWHCFWRTYYGDYLGMLAQMARDRGVTVPLYHNLPGWIYGNGYEFPVNITMYEDLFGEKSEILFGIDHIPEFFSYRNLHDDRIINDVTYAMQGAKPLFAAEFQSGSREYQVVTNPREMELFYKASLANGLVGWNYYMFSQGRNQRHRGYSGETFYWFTPLTPEGERNSAFPLVKRMSKLVSTSESIIVEAKRKAEICVLFYPPYYSTELARPAGQECEILFDYSAIRRPAYFDGLLKALQLLNVDYDMIDLSRANGEALSKYKQLWAFCTDEMNAVDQQALVDYITAGGNAVIFPYLPDREMSQRPCTALRDALSISPGGCEAVHSPLVDIFGLNDIKCANPQITYPETSLSGADVIARTIRGTACGFSKAIGKGSVIHLGTWIGFDTEGHKLVYEAILKRSGAKLRQASASNDYITVRERFTGNHSGVLFIGNYYNEDQIGKVHYTHPESGEDINIPYFENEIIWPALYGVLSPLCLEAMDGLKILHCTSDIIGVAAGSDRVEITLFGDRDLEGEIVLEGCKIREIKAAVIDGEEVKLLRDGNRLVLLYRHKHKKEMRLSVVMN